MVLASRIPSSPERLTNLVPLLYATPSVDEAASHSYSTVWKWGHNSKFGRDTEQFYDLQDAYHLAEIELLKRIRADLSIPDE